MNQIVKVFWKDEGDFGFISTVTQADLDSKAADPGTIGLPYDPNRVRQTGSLEEAAALAREHDAELVYG